MDSLMAVRMRNTMRGDFGVEPPVALLLQGASLADLAVDLIRQLGLAERIRDTPTDFAIGHSNVPQRANEPQRGGRQDNGLTRSTRRTRCRPTRLRSSAWPEGFRCRLGVAFWGNLRRGEESIVTFSEDELIAAGVSEHALANPPMCGVRRSSTGSRSSTRNSSGSLRTPPDDGPATAAVPAVRMARAGRRRYDPATSTERSASSARVPPAAI